MSIELKENRTLDLSMYFFTVQDSMLIPTVIPLEGQVVLAYTPQEAINTVIIKYPDKKVLIQQRGEIKIKDLLMQFNLPAKETLVLQTEPTEPKIMDTKENFISNLRLVVDKWVDNEKDKRIIKKILEKYE